MNYSVLVRKTREQIHDFSGKLSTLFSVPQRRFIEQMIYGLCAGQDVKLSSVARSLEEDVPLIATEKRLSRNLDTSDMDIRLQESLAKLGSRRVHDETLLVVDISDVRKNHAKKMEHLGRVRDGDTGELVDGYWLLNVVACKEGTSRIAPLYQSLYSAEAPGFDSENTQILHAIDMVREPTKGRGIWVIDRGGDRVKLLRPFLKRGMRFIVRLRGDRHLVFRGRKRLARDIAWGCPTYYAETIVKQSGDGEIAHRIEYGFRKVKLPGREEELYMVVVKGFGQNPLMLLTSLPMRKKRSTLWSVVGGYLTRWRIEEAIRFIKQSYKLEDIRVLSYQRLKNLVVLVAATSFFIASHLGGHIRLEALARRALKAAKRFFGIAPFRYYALADGIAAILAHSTQGPLCLPRPPTQKQFLQLEFNLF